jgi:translation elongation factor EF-Tu-like GTPase
MRKVIRASLKLEPSEAGGREEPLRSGYRSLLRLQGCDTDFGFELVLDEVPGSEGLKPGNAGTGYLLFWAVDKLQQFEIREGTQIIGSGEIIQIDVA